MPSERHSTIITLFPTFIDTSLNPNCSRHWNWKRKKNPKNRCKISPQTALMRWSRILLHSRSCSTLVHCRRTFDSIPDYRKKCSSMAWVRRNWGSLQTRGSGRTVILWQTIRCHHIRTKTAETQIRKQDGIVQYCSEYQ